MEGWMDREREGERDVCMYFKDLIHTIVEV